MITQVADASFSGYTRVIRLSASALLQTGIGWLAIAGWGNPVFAQITPDNTLGAESSTVTPNVNIKGAPAEQINGGAVRGGNLFHSFLEFNVRDGQRVYFANPSGIQNILTRVTGNDTSDILGTLGVNGNANLFLINPNGIIFGRNARLDVGGSFVASTASSIKFADGNQFSATASATPLLTISTPMGLQFGDSGGRILVQGNGRGLRTREAPEIDTNEALRVRGNQTIALVGGDVALVGGTLKTAGGRIELGSVAGSGFVSLTPTAKGFTLGYEGISNFGNIQLSRASAVDASSNNGGGEIQLTGGMVTLKDGSQMEVTTLSNGRGGILRVVADIVEISGSTANNPQDNRRFPSSLAVDNRADKKEVPGELTINTRRVIIRNGGRVSASNASTGVGGNINVNASDSVELIGTFTAPGGLRPSGISVQTSGGGNGGKLTINTRNLTIRDGAEASASTFGAGNGGEVEVNASDSVQLIGTSPNGEFPSALIAEVGRNSRQIPRPGGQQSQAATAKGGSVIVRTGQLTVRDGAVVGVSSGSIDGKGAGDIDITAQNIRLDAQNRGEGIIADTRTGDGGNINLQVQELIALRRGSKISTTAGTERRGGNGGDITINTGFLVAFPEENNDITANAFKGSGGNVNITAQSIFGLEPLSRQELQALLGTDKPEELDPSKLRSNDITAISQENPSLSGNVIINTPDTDPSRGLVQLPGELVDAAELIAQNLCTARGEASEFVVTGRGGLPDSPKETLSPDATWEDWRMVDREVGGRSDALTQTDVAKKLHVSGNIVEAQGWVVDADGTVILTAEPVAGTVRGTWWHPLDCHRLRVKR
jgi:filamentous hemagglutinin family protein